MSDADEIRNLIARYTHCIDDQRAEELSALFSEDAVWVTPVGTRRGRKEIYEKAVETLQPFKERRTEGEKSKHLAVNSVIDIDGDTATACSDFLVVKSGPNGGMVTRGGRYEDAFVKENGTWRFSKRVHYSGAFHPDAAYETDNYR